MPFDSLPVDVPLTKCDQRAWEILRDTHEYLKDKNRWTQYKYKDEKQVCLMGGIFLSIGYYYSTRPSSLWGDLKVLQHIEKLITEWNDHSLRDHVAVVEALARAERAILTHKMPSGGIANWLVEYSRRLAVLMLKREEEAIS